jgi:hypothetical protein
VLDIGGFVRLALDPVRLAVLGSASLGTIDTGHLAAGLGVDERRVLRELGRLEKAGLIASGRLETSTLRDLARSLPSAAPPDPEVTAGEWSHDEERILGSFFSGSRLTRIPEKHAKRLVVLERLAQEFEPGIRYGEREVDFTLQMFHADHAALRRHLVDEGFMTRADGVYWRTGGRT